MKIFVTGGSGFIGSRLVEAFRKSGYQISVLSRRERSGESKKNITYIQGDPNLPGNWQETAAGHDGIINLAGAPIFQRWSKKTKEKISQSRVRSTRNVVDALIAKESPQSFLINASAVGYYGFRGDEMLDESSAPGDDFLSRVTKAWEKEAKRAAEYNIRTVCLRFGIVLGKGEGALPQFDMLGRYFFGARLGRGEQWLSWIHIDDLIRIFRFMTESGDRRGVWNATAPYPVKNKILMRTLSEILDKPAWSPVIPGIFIKLGLGEFGGTLLLGQRVIPAKLNQSDFDFKYPDIRKALENLYSNHSQK
jgi:uncharacterized protein